jgi:hypothetical protein
MNMEELEELRIQRRVELRRWRQPDYLPTPREIAQKCSEIQKSWSDDERYRRTAYVAAEGGFDECA